MAPVIGIILRGLTFIFSRMGGGGGGEWGSELKEDVSKNDSNAIVLRKKTL